MTLKTTTFALSALLSFSSALICQVKQAPPAAPKTSQLSSGKPQWPYPPPEKWAPDRPNVSGSNTALSFHIFAVKLELSAPGSIEGPLRSAILAELRKRADVQVVSGALAEFNWQLFCVQGVALACSSVMLNKIDLLDMESYFPELKDYGIWWKARTLNEDAGWISYHGVYSGPGDDPVALSRSLVAAMESQSFEYLRKQWADAAVQSLKK